MSIGQPASPGQPGSPGLAGSTLHAFPEVPRRQRENASAMLFPHTLLQTRRLLTRSLRDPMTMIQSIVYPALMLVMLDIVLGQQVSAFAGHSSLYGTVPMITILSAMLGSVAGAVTLGREWDAGVLARFWVLPVHRASALAARTVAEALRILATTVVIAAVGLVLGFRFDGSVWALLGFLAVPIVFGLAFATAVTGLSFYVARTTLVEAVSLLCSLLMFFNPGFVPLAAYPNWISPFVENQPMSCAITAMTALALGDPAGNALVKTAAWSIGLFVVFVVPTVRGYRRATRSR